MPSGATLALIYLTTPPGVEIAPIKGANCVGQVTAGFAQGPYGSGISSAAQFFGVTVQQAHAFILNLCGR